MTVHNFGSIAQIFEVVVNYLTQGGGDRILIQLSQSRQSFNIL
ncbi:hypothetical protein [Nodularia sp. UHCC 0506]